MRAIAAWRDGRVGSILHRPAEHDCIDLSFPDVRPCNASCWRRARENTCNVAKLLHALLKSMCSRLGVQQHVRPQRKPNDTPPRGESLLAGTRNAYVNCGARTTARGRIGHACICRASLARATRDVPTSRARVARCARRACNLRTIIARDVVNASAHNGARCYAQPGAQH